MATVPSDTTMIPIILRSADAGPAAVPVPAPKSTHHHRHRHREEWAEYDDATSKKSPAAATATATGTTVIPPPIPILKRLPVLTTSRDSSAGLGKNNGLVFVHFEMPKRKTAILLAMVLTLWRVERVRERQWPMSMLFLSQHHEAGRYQRLPPEIMTMSK